jgi:hypothetical protein
VEVIDRRALLSDFDTALRQLEKPLTTSDYAAQVTGLDAVRTALRALSVPNLDALDFSMRGRAYTALLRAGRQTTPEADPAREEARKRVHLVLANIWKAMGDERRAAHALEMGGRAENAATLLRQTGDWSDVAALFEREGRFVEAAKLFEMHRADTDAARCHRAAKDHRGALRCLLKAGDKAGARAVARELDPAGGVELLLRVGAPELAEELLAERGEWVRLAQLREQRRDFAAAAQAREQAGDLDKAAIDWRRAGNESAAMALAERAAAPALERADKLGAAEVFARFRVFGRAAELALPERPDRAHAWFSRGGLDAEALALAQKEARRATAQNRIQNAAQWHERAGDAALAAEAWEQVQRWKDALRLHEQLGQWERAALCCERTADLAKACDFYRRAGLPEAAERVERRAERSALAVLSAGPSTDS